MPGDRVEGFGFRVSDDRVEGALLSVFRVQGVGYFKVQSYSSSFRIKCTQFAQYTCNFKNGVFGVYYSYASINPKR